MGECEEAVDNFTEIEVPVPWGHVSGKWWGSKAMQPAIALHGWQDNAGSFDNLARLLTERGHSILCLDLPGHGLSSHYPAGQYYYVYWDFVPLLRRITNHFHWPRNLVLMGHSLGAAVGFMYAAMFPDHVTKFVSLDMAGPYVRNPVTYIPLLGPSIDKYLDYETKYVVDVTSDVAMYGYEEMIDTVEDAYKGSCTRASCEIMMKRGMKPVNVSQQSTIDAADNKGNEQKYTFRRDPRLKVAAMAMVSADHVLEMARCIRCDVLNIRGEPGMLFELPEMYGRVLDVLEESARSVQRCVVGGTHHLHLNNAEDIVDVVDKFLMQPMQAA